jgi:Lon protease-like protein
VAELIPLFPLSHVLVPGMPLPLHIFEQRYQQLLEDIADGDSGGSFGVVALRTGTEAAAPGSPNAESEGLDLESIGTLAEILEVERQEDGTADLLAVGSRRFRILNLAENGRPYVEAEVEYLDEPDGELTADQETRARELIDVYDAMLMRIAGRGTGAELPGDANQLSYHLAARLPLPPGERQALLNDATTAERLKRVARLLRREIALLQRTRSIAVSPAVLRMVTGAN